MEASKVIELLGTFNVRLSGPRVGVLRDPSDTKVGSLHIPDTAQKLRRQGTIVALGDELSKRVVLGERVVLPVYQAVEFKMSLGNESVAIESLHENDLHLVWPSDYTDEVQDARTLADTK